MIKSLKKVRATKNNNNINTLTKTIYLFFTTLSSVRHSYFFMFLKQIEKMYL